MIRFQDNLYLTYSRILVVFCCCYAWICHLELSILYLIADDAYSIFYSILNLVVLLAGPISQTSFQHMDFVNIFNVSLDLSTIYFAHWVLSFLCVWLLFYPRKLYPLFLSQVEYKIVLFYQKAMQPLGCLET